MSEVKTEQTGVLAEYSEIQASLTALKAEYADKVYDVATTAGLKEAKVDRALFRTGRTDVEKVRKALKGPHLDRGRKIDSDAKLITAAFAELEEPVSELIKAEEDKKAAAKAEKERIEVERIQGIQDRINDLRFNLGEYHPSKDIQKFIDTLGLQPFGDDFGEFLEMAQTVADDSFKKAEVALAKALAREQEAAEQEVTKAMLKKQSDAQAKEQAELDKQRKAQEAKQAELDAKTAEAAALTEDIKPVAPEAPADEAEDEKEGRVPNFVPGGYDLSDTVDPADAFRRIYELASMDYNGFPQRDRALAEIKAIAEQQIDG